MCLKGRKKKEKNEGGTSEDVELHNVTTKGSPDWIAMYPPKVTMYLNTNPGKPTFEEVLMKNTSEKKVAYKIFCNEMKLFTITPSSGIMQPDEQITIKIDFQNQVVVDARTIYLLHYYYAYMESDVVPEAYRPEYDKLPKKCDGENLMWIYMALGKSKILLKTLPPEINIRGTIGIRGTKLLTFYPDAESKRPTAYITILNTSTTKYCAFTVRNTNQDVLRTHRRCGVIPPGQIKIVKASCKTQPDMSKKDDSFIVFVALIDTAVPPEQFKKNFLAVPTEYDACRFLEVAWAEEMCPPGGGASREPLSQTGAPDTEADAAAPDASGAPPPAPGAPPYVA